MPWVWHQRAAHSTSEGCVQYQFRTPLHFAGSVTVNQDSQFCICYGIDVIFVMDDEMMTVYPRPGETYRCWGYKAH